MALEKIMIIKTDELHNKLYEVIDMPHDKATQLVREGIGIQITKEQEKTLWWQKNSHQIFKDD